MPALPKKYAKGLARRSSSAEPPQRLLSSPPPKVDGRGASLDRGQGTAQKRNTKPKARPQAEAASMSLRHSVNFSRPISPPASPTSSVPDPPQPEGPARGLISPADLENVHNLTQEAAARTVKKKKKKVAAGVVEGSHLAGGTTPGRAKGTAVDSKEQNTMHAKRTTRASTPNESVEPKVGAALAEDAVPPIPLKATSRLSKQPSMVREDPEGEASEEIDAAPELLPTEIPATSEHPPTEEPPSHLGTVKERTTPEAPAERPRDRNSLSPPGASSFSRQSGQQIRHSPPARSISPTKSALKRSSSRGSSPSDARSSSLNRHTSEPQDNLSVGSDDVTRSHAKKKGVRVSFDDDAVFVGEAAETLDQAESPVIQSPQSKDLVKRWWSRSNGAIDESDNTMQPVPALPSFDSVRGRNVSEERSTERPQAGTNMPSYGASADHATAAIVSQSSARLPLKSSFADPLPPEVTTVEGSGDHSESDGEATEEPEPTPNGHTAKVPKEEVSHDREPPPSIAILPATPSMEDEKSYYKHQTMPGEFPAEPLPWATETSASVSYQTPSDVGLAEPAPDEAVKYESPAAGKATQMLSQYNQETEDLDDSGDSIYSDAAEDASDFEGDGFG